MSNVKDIIYNCQQATYLIEKKAFAKLTFKENIELQIHLMGCDACKLYVKQSQKITAMMKQLLKADVKNDIQLDERFKNTLQAQINNQLNKN